MWQGLPATAAAWALVAVAIGVLLLYLLKPAARRLTIPSMVIWRQVLRTRKRTPDRLRWWISLLLALLIALAIAAALVRPQLALLGGGAQQVVIVLDDSATLAAIASDGKTRFDHALARSRELIRAGGDGLFMIADTRGQIAMPHFEPRDGALATLAKLTPGAGGRLQFPQLSAGGEARRRIVLLTDGVAAIEVPQGVEIMSVYQVADNVGITAFDVRPQPRDPRRYQAFVEIYNASPNNKRVDLTLAGAGAASLQRTLQLAAGARATEVLDVSGYAAGPLRVSVDSSYDALPTDDVAFAYLPPTRPLHVVLVTPGNAALERSLRVLPRLQLTVIAPGRYAARSGVDAWIFDRFAPPEPPSAPALLFRPTRADWLPRPAGDVRETAVASWSATHPVTENVSLRDVLVERTLHLRDTGRAQVIATDAAQRPLIVASNAGPRWVEVAFAMEDSNLALQAGFPALLSNALSWMTGEPLALQAKLGLVEVPVTQAKVLDLQGQPVTVREVPGVTLIDVARPGFYTAISPERRVRVAVSALDTSITAVNRTALANAPPAGPAARAGAVLATPWLALLALAAVLLLVEWWTYNRRLTV